ncbi:DUF3097 family protein, partial [Kocuria oceani]
MSDYGWGPRSLDDAGLARRKPVSAEVPVAPGLLLEDVTTGWVGAVVSLETIGGMRVMGLEDRRGRVKAFPLGPGFLLEGEPVVVVEPRRAPAAKR